MNEEIIIGAKNFFEKEVKDLGDPFNLAIHVPQVVRWAQFVQKKYPESDKEVILLSAWLHDLGHLQKNSKIDHAVIGAQKAKEFLEREKYPREKIERVLHCIRAHRCRDIIPETIEAKIIAFSDSASHMTTWTYFDMSMQDKDKNNEFRAYEKLERDFRDLSHFPEIKNKLEPLYNSWKTLLKSYEDFDFEDI